MYHIPSDVLYLFFRVLHMQFMIHRFQTKSFASSLKLNYSVNGYINFHKCVYTDRRLHSTLPANNMLTVPCLLFSEVEWNVFFSLEKLLSFVYKDINPFMLVTAEAWFRCLK